MDLLPIKSKDEQAAARNSGALQMATIAATFTELMKKTSSAQPSGGDGFSEQAELVSRPERAEPSRPAQDDPFDRRDTAPADDGEAASARDDHTDDSRPARAAVAEDRPRDTAAHYDAAPRPDGGEAPRAEAGAATDGLPAAVAGPVQPTAPTSDHAAARQGTTAAGRSEGAATADAAVAVVAAQAVQAPEAPAAIETAEIATPAQAAVAAAAAGETARPQGAAKPGEHGLEAKAKAAANPAIPQTAPTGTGDKPAQQAAAPAAPAGDMAGDPDALADADAPIGGDRPAATTASPTSPINDANRANQHGQTAAAGANGQPAAPNAQQAPAPLQPAQPAAAGQAAAATGDTKAAVQAMQSSATGTTHAGEAGLSGQPGGTAAMAHSQRTAAAQAAQAPRFVQAGPGFAEQISVQISKAAAEGLDRINIQLRPAELGRIQVELNIGADGQVSAVVTADNKSTLDLLQRDARNLEQALQNAGLDLNSGDLTFNLRERQDQGQPESDGRYTAERPAVEEPPLEELLNPAYRGQSLRADGRIDILT